MYFLELRGVDWDQGGLLHIPGTPPSPELLFLTGNIRELDQVRARFIHPKI